MKGMNSNTERIAGARLSELGTPVRHCYRQNNMDKSKMHLGANENDCISCTKHLTHKIPMNKVCKSICGT